MDEKELKQRTKNFAHRCVKLAMALPEYFQNKDLRLILFGGKGGVGKTTMAATAAVHMARSHYKGKKVLVISTDPAHSLGDSFGIEIGDKVTPISYSPTSNLQSSIDNLQSPIPNLYARELNAGRLADEFKRKNEAVIKKLADRGTYFDQQDIAEFFELSLPGMDEVFAIIEIANLLKEESYDLLILDTAPTGHTVRMLALPEQMRKWIEVMDLMQHKHRYMAAHFTGKKYVKDECDIFLDNLSADINRVKKLLSNMHITRFVAVMIPEPMSIYETRTMIGSLEKMKVPVKEIIVNRVVESDGCPFCTAKKEDQRAPLAEIEESFSQYNLIKVPVFPNEIRGIEKLQGLADYFLGISGPISSPKAIQADEMTQASLAINPDVDFILFGGKGGVGKTSLASTAALHLAQRNPEKKVLVFSTDPAHSLSDSFKLSIGDKVTPIEWSEVRGQRSEVSNQQPAMSSNEQRVTSNEQRAKSNDQNLQSSIDNRQSSIPNNQSPMTNLFALEINADKLFEDFKQDFKKDIEDIFNKFLGGGVDIKFDREVMTELLTLAPPGLDEIMALNTIMDLKKEGKFDIFVLDTSPTGHLIRFLELPDIVRQWLNAFFRLLLKYKGVLRLAKAAEKALALSKNVRKIKETLTNPEKTAFVAVTIPEAMGLFELERLVEALDKAGIPCEHIAVNMIVPQTDCDFCSLKRGEQQGYIKKIHSTYPTRMVTKVPLFPHNVRGINDLNKMGQIIF